MIKHLRTGIFLSATLVAVHTGFAAGPAGEAAGKRLEREVRREPVDCASAEIRLLWRRHIRGCRV